jgi:hypothetical protein
LSDKFDVNTYANAILAGKIYDPESPTFAEGSGSYKNGKARDTEKGDVGVELARLNYGIVRCPSPATLAASRLILCRRT